MTTQKDTFSAPQTLVVGLGVTGLSCVRFLVQQGVPVAVCDSRDIPPGLAELQQEHPDIALFIGGFDASAFAAAERLVVSPGVSLQEPVILDAIHRGVEVTGDVDLFLQAAKAPVIAITGSNGKSTVTTLVGEMARAAGVRVGVGGNLGTPVLDLLNDENALYVLELSSFQLELIHHLEAEAAVVLNLSEDHMDRYESYADYVAAKAVIYQNARHLIVNRDDVCAASLAGHQAVTGFSLAQPQQGDFGLCQINGAEWLCHGEEPLMLTIDLLIAGRHNIANVLAALALGNAAGLPMTAMLAAARSFTGLAHRTQYLGEKNGVRWYNDSKGTNVGAVISALKGLDQDDFSRTVLIAGGDCKGADFSDLATQAPAYLRALILIGRDAPAIAAVMRGRTEINFAQNMRDAVDQAAAAAQPGDRVLLSPACASYDMFKNYIERGEVFMAEVGRLLK